MDGDDDFVDNLLEDVEEYEQEFDAEAVEKYREAERVQEILDKEAGRPSSAQSKRAFDKRVKEMFAEDTAPEVEEDVDGARLRRKRSNESLAIVTILSRRLDVAVAAARHTDSSCTDLERYCRNAMMGEALSTEEKREIASFITYVGKFKRKHLRELTDMASKFRKKLR